MLRRKICEMEWKIMKKFIRISFCIAVLCSVLCIDLMRKSAYAMTLDTSKPGQWTSEEQDKAKILPVVQRDVKQEQKAVDAFPQHLVYSRTTEGNETIRVLARGQPKEADLDDVVLVDDPGQPNHSSLSTVQKEQKTGLFGWGWFGLL